MEAEQVLDSATSLCFAQNDAPHYCHPARVILRVVAGRRTQDAESTLTKNRNRQWKIDLIEKQPKSF
jgi:hypothetical protein